MVNNDRIVPIQKIDFLSLIATVYNLLSDSEINVMDGENGVFSVYGSGNAGTWLANEPLSSLNFTEGVTAGVVLFVADYDFKGFKVANTSVEPAEGSEEVKPDGITLYKATLASGNVTVISVTPAAVEP